MTERLYLDRPDVHLVVGWDEDHNTGQVCLVVCERASGAEYASLLAARLGVPLKESPLPGGSRYSRSRSDQPLPDPDAAPVPVAEAVRRRVSVLAT